MNRTGQVLYVIWLDGLLIRDIISLWEMPLPRDFNSGSQKRKLGVRRLEFSNLGRKTNKNPNEQTGNNESEDGIHFKVSKVSIILIIRLWLTLLIGYPKLHSNHCSPASSTTKAQSP